MTDEASAVSIELLEVVKAQGEEPVFKAGDAVRISRAFPSVTSACRLTFVASVAGSSQ